MTDVLFSEVNEDTLKAAYFIQTTVTSTRIRLARNLYSYPFPNKLDVKQAEEVKKAIRRELARLDEFNEYDLNGMTRDEAMRLQEKHLISPALIRRKKISAAFVTSDETVSVMVNEEDHLREQYIVKGLDLVSAYRRISGVDEEIARTVLFAYDEKLGYLTACPSNLGTGLRASVMMFLPALTEYKMLDGLLPSLKKNGLTVRGAYGEGTAAEGFTYQISNERTLGLSEEEILAHMKEVALSLADIEVRMRKRMLEEEPRAALERCLRAYGRLMSAAELSYKNFSADMSLVKLGATLGFFDMKGTTVKDGMSAINAFTASMQPVTFRLNSCPADADEKECDRLRAVAVQRELAKTVKRAKYTRQIPFA